MLSVFAVIYERKLSHMNSAIEKVKESNLPEVLPRKGTFEKPIKQCHEHDQFCCTTTRLCVIAVATVSVNWMHCFRKEESKLMLHWNYQ